MTREQISATGIFSSNARVLTRNSNRGFTLLELVVVLVVLAGAAALVLPRLSAWQDHDARNSARNLATMLRYLHEQAITSRTRYQLAIDLNQQKLSVQQLRASGEATLADDPFLQRNPLLGATRLSDVNTERSGTVSSGSLKIAYGVGGLSEPLVLHLGIPGGQQYTVQTLPVNGSVKVAEGSLDMIK